MREHGSNGYSRGCRCAECREGKRVATAADRQRRKGLREKEDGVLVYRATPVTHGIKSTYLNYFCRCADCTRANTEGNRGTRVSQRQRRAPTE
jgi:hypothetical protein